jgi:hypothetical protein
MEGHAKEGPLNKRPHEAFDFFAGAYRRDVPAIDGRFGLRHTTSNTDLAIAGMAAPPRCTRFEGVNAESNSYGIFD